MENLLILEMMLASLKSVSKNFFFIVILSFSFSTIAEAKCIIVNDYIEKIKTLDLISDACNRILLVSESPKLLVKILVTEKIKEPNAFATQIKGENIIIFTKAILIDLEKNSRALPFIVGHELAHLLSGHVSSSKSDDLIDAIISSAKSSFGGLFPSGSQSVIDLSIKAMEITNSQHKEIEADLLSKNMMLKAGYPQSDIIFAIDLLITQSKMPAWGRFFSTHPDPVTRKKHLTNKNF